MEEPLRVGMLVKIHPDSPYTMETHGLFHSRKKALLGTVQPIDKIRDELTVVIKKWHFHPKDLRQLYDDTPVARKPYVETFFNVEVLE